MRARVQDPLPLSRFEQASGSWEELAFVLRREIATIHPRPPRRAARSGTVRMAALPEMSLLAIRYGSAQQARVEPFGDHFLLLMTSAGWDVGRHGRQHYVMDRHHLLLASPWEASSYRTSADVAYLGLRIPRSVFEDTFRAWTGEPPRSRLAFDPQLDAAGGVGHQLRPLVWELAERLDRGDGSLSVAARGRALASGLATTLLLGHGHTLRARMQRRAPLASFAQVRRVEEHLFERSHEPVTAQDLARIGGVSLRSLERSFRRIRGCSPLEWLAALRLERARSRLLDPRDGDDVTRIALASGFTHLGRFSGDYRDRFAEPPSDTLRRARAAAQPR